ncbi:unnamed protein product [Closterium sp. NIES-65]|nr:unnamed protein product [Closterium sp. NIES-65]
MRQIPLSSEPFRLLLPAAAMGLFSLACSCLGVLRLHIFSLCAACGVALLLRGHGSPSPLPQPLRCCFVSRHFPSLYTPPERHQDKLVALRQAGGVEWGERVCIVTGMGEGGSDSGRGPPPQPLLHGTSSFLRFSPSLPLHIPPERHQDKLVTLSGESEYASSLASGRVAVIVDENPYLAVFTSHFCDVMQAQQPFSSLNLAFAFQKGSALGHDISNAIGALRMTQEVEKLHAKYFSSESVCPQKTTAVQFGIQRFGGLYIIYLVVSTACCIIYVALLIYRGYRYVREKGVQSLVDKVKSFGREPPGGSTEEGVDLVDSEDSLGSDKDRFGPLPGSQMSRGSTGRGSRGSLESGELRESIGSGSMRENKRGSMTAGSSSRPPRIPQPVLSRASESSLGSKRRRGSHDGQEDESAADGLSRERAAHASGTSHREPVSYRDGVAINEQAGGKEAAGGEEQGSRDKEHLTPSHFDTHACTSLATSTAISPSRSNHSSLASQPSSGTNSSAASRMLKLPRLTSIVPRLPSAENTFPTNRSLPSSTVPTRPPFELPALPPASTLPAFSSLPSLGSIDLPRMESFHTKVDSLVDKFHKGKEWSRERHLSAYNAQPQQSTTAFEFRSASASSAHSLASPASSAHSLASPASSAHSLASPASSAHGFPSPASSISSESPSGLQRKAALCGTARSDQVQHPGDHQVQEQAQATSHLPASPVTPHSNCLQNPPLKLTFIPLRTIPCLQHPSHLLKAQSATP